MYNKPPAFCQGGLLSKSNYGDKPMSTLNINDVRLAGNVGNDIELKQLANKTIYCQFNLATTTERKDAEGNTVESIEWHRCIAFGEIAKHLEETCQKGTNIYMTGKLQSRFFKDPNGIKQERTEVLVRAYQAISGMKEKEVDIDAILQERIERDEQKRKEQKNDSEVPY